VNLRAAWQANPVRFKAVLYLLALLVIMGVVVFGTTHLAIAADDAESRNLYVSVSVGVFTGLGSGMLGTAVLAVVADIGTGDVTARRVGEVQSAAIQGAASATQAGVAADKAAQAAQAAQQALEIYPARVTKRAYQVAGSIAVVAFLVGRRCR